MKVPYPTSTSTEPNFVKDILPFFLPCLFYILFIAFHQYWGNPAITGWIMFVLTPLYNRFVLDDDWNLSKAAERKYEKAGLFNAPLYATCLFCALAWLHGLMLFSGEYKDHETYGVLFKHTPMGVWEQFAYFTSLSALAVIS